MTTRPLLIKARHQLNIFLRFLSWFCLGGLLPLAFAQSSIAAQRVTITFGIAEISTSVEALSVYGETGKVDAELAPLIDFLDSEQRSQLRQILQARQEVSPVAVSQFLYSSIGQNILRYLGGIVQTQGRQNGAKGLRGALILAAAEPEGLSVLGVLENFPTSTVRIDSLQGLQNFKSFTQLVDDTDRAISLIKNLSSSPSRVNAASSTLPALTLPGPAEVTLKTLAIEDSDRMGGSGLGEPRMLPTDLYLPENQSAPLIVISHGLGGDRRDFSVLAEHLASHGFAVAAIEHPGSNFKQFENLLSGAAREIAKPTEFTDRPRDISYLLDELTRLSEPNAPLANRLDMNRIGLIGHSFGGYTVLALAGAQLNFDTLKANCESDQFVFKEANPSMLLQCTALKAPEQFATPLKDDRIQAVMAINPVTSSLFGPTGFAQIGVPSLLVGGSDDPVAPALLEQIRPFTWLNQLADVSRVSPTPAHYLAIIEGGSHLYDLPEQASTDDSTDVFDSSVISLENELESANPSLAYRYLEALSLGFMQAEIERNPRDRNELEGDALEVASIRQLSQPQLPLYLVESLTEAMLNTASEASEETLIEETAPKSSLVLTVE